MIEKEIRGGMVNGLKRYSKANNKYLSDHKPDESSKYLMYFDANNLYSWAMKQKLPTGGFEFENEAIIDHLNDENCSTHNNCNDRYTNKRNKKQSCIKKYNEYLNKSSKGCILEVDIEYPKELHILHNDFPLCPENEN